MICFLCLLYVLLVSGARHRLGPPALLLLRYVILEKTWHRGERRMELNFRSAARRTKRETDEWNIPQSPGQSPSRLPRHLQPHWPTVLLLPSTCLEQLTLKHKERRLETNRIQTGREIGFSSSGRIQRGKHSVKSFNIYCSLCPTICLIITCRAVMM